MRNRIRATGTALTLALTFGATGLTGVAMAGEDTPPPPPPVTETVTVPVDVPGPTTTVTVPAPAPKATTETSSGSGSGGGSSNSSSNNSTPAATTVSVADTSVDTGTVPQGGVQAGFGGTAAKGGASALMALIAGLLVFAITSGGVALRRRAAQH